LKNNPKSQIQNRDASIAVIGLGYVGLPLAIEFSKKYPTVGFDLNEDRIKQLKKGIGNTLEVDENFLRIVASRKKLSGSDQFQHYKAEIKAVVLFSSLLPNRSQNVAERAKPYLKRGQLNC